MEFEFHLLKALAFGPTDQEGQLSALAELRTSTRYQLDCREFHVSRGLWVLGRDELRPQVGVAVWLEARWAQVEC